MKRNLKKNWLVAVAAFVAVSFIGCSNGSEITLPTVADVLPGIQVVENVWGSGSNITKTGDYYTITSGTGWDSNGSASIPCSFEAGKISGAKGATAVVENAMINATADHLTGSPIYMDKVSVGATINILMAAVLAEGKTVIDNAAREPHVVDVANFLNSMGANIKGAGTDVIRIRGVEKLHKTD